MTTNHAFILWLAAGIAMSSTTVFSETKQDLPSKIRSCANLSSDLARLKCFDQLASTLEPDAAQEKDPLPTGTGKWSVSRSKNPIDDSTTITAILDADEGSSQWGSPIAFVARCQSNKTEAYAIWHDYVGDDSNDIYNEWKYVTVRVGDGKASKQKWSVSTDKQATFVPGWAGNLLNRIAEVDKLVLQMTPYNKSPVVAVFDVRGAAEAFKPIADTCDWKVRPGE